MRRILELCALVAQTLFYTAGVMAFVQLILLGYLSNERMQREHEQIMLLTQKTLQEVLKR